MGFGASLVTAVAALNMALKAGRVLIIHSEWNDSFFAGLHNASGCPNREASNPWECYFEPASNTCTIQDALKAANVGSVTRMLANKKLAQWTFRDKIGKLRRPIPVTPSTRTVFVDIYMPYLSKESQVMKTTHQERPITQTVCSCLLTLSHNRNLHVQRGHTR